MKIGLIAPPWVPVPPPAYGGTEGVVDVLARGLHDRGHDVVLFTVGESTCPVPKAWYYDTAYTPMNFSAAEASHALAAYDRLADCDLIHDHTLLGPLMAADDVPSHVALAVTNHGRFTPEVLRILSRRPERMALVTISRSHRASAPGLVSTAIHHGLDLDMFTPGAGDGGYLLFVGRFSDDKGPDRAIRIARAAGLPLVIAAKCREDEELDYFRSRVEPLLGADVTMAGEAGPAERVALMRHALAVVNPIGWPEPFGLVMAEALACGTPVLACPRGAAPEIVDDGVTGFLRDEESDLAAAVGRLGEIDRDECRRQATERFSMERMVKDHETLYAELVADAQDRSLGRSGVTLDLADLPR